MNSKKIVKNVFCTMLVSLLFVFLFTACSRKQVSKETKASSQQETSESEETKIVMEQETEESANITGKKEISMEEAISIAEKEAVKYYDKLQLTEVHSYDNDENRATYAGETGKRQWWYVTLANEDENYVDVLMKDGEVYAVDPIDEEPNNGLFRVSDINMTSKEAVQKAKRLGLRGGNPKNEAEWVSGYNFKLEYGSFMDDPDKTRLYLEVIGISRNGNFAHVDFDAITGELILAEEKIEHKNGNDEWRTFR